MEGLRLKRRHHYNRVETKARVKNADQREQRSEAKLLSFDATKMDSRGKQSTGSIQGGAKVGLPFLV